MHAESADVRLLYSAEGKFAIASKNNKSDLNYLALFNISDSLSLDLEASLSDLGLSGTVTITDMWSGEELGTYRDTFIQNLSTHASGLYKIEHIGPWTR